MEISGPEDARARNTSRSCAPAISAISAACFRKPSTAPSTRRRPPAPPVPLPLHPGGRVPGYQPAQSRSSSCSPTPRTTCLPSAMPTRAFTSGAAPARRDEAISPTAGPRPGDVRSSSSASTTARPRRSSRLPTRSSATPATALRSISRPPAPPVEPPAAPAARTRTSRGRGNEHRRAHA